MMAKTDGWRSRIVGHDSVDPTTLNANPRNHRTHPRNQRAVVRDSISELGFVKSILVNKTTGLLLDGHERLWHALEAHKLDSEVRVDVEYVELTPEEEAKALAILDASSELAGIDSSKLDELLASFETGSGAITQMLDDLAKSADLSSLHESLGDDPEAIPNDAEARCKLGDVWLLGPHRLVCGDCTDVSVLRVALDGNMADMVFTDPPYNVAYTGGTSEKLTIMNDEMSGDDFLEFLQKVFSSIAANTKPGGVAYICHADSEGVRFRQAFEESGFLLKQCLVWVKNTLVLGRQDYQWKHEPILYGWKKGAAHKFFGDRRKSTVFESVDGVMIDGDLINVSIGGRLVVIKATDIEVVSDGCDESDSIWRIDKPVRNADHPTMKPVRLCSRAISHGSRKGEIVLDAFLGSGSTLIAAEKLGRRCCGTELDPKYCDVIVRRWEKLTGQTAVLDDG